MVYFACASASASVEESQADCAALQASSATITNRASPNEVCTSFEYQGCGRCSAAMYAAKLASCGPPTAQALPVANAAWHSWLPSVIHQVAGPEAMAAMYTPICARASASSCAWESPPWSLQTYMWSPRSTAN